MNYEIVNQTFRPLANPEGLKVVMLLRSHERTLSEVASDTGLNEKTSQTALEELIKAGLVIRVRNENDTEDYFGISPFGAYGAVNMLKEILNVEQGCKGCHKDQ